MHSRLIIYTFLLLTLIGVWFQLTQPIMSMDNTNVVSADPDRLRRHVEHISQTFYPRHEAHPANLTRLAIYIKDAFEQTTHDVSQHTYQVNSNPYHNIYANFGPDTPVRIIIGAHYDTVPNTPGADDNASGIAGLIELAQLLKNTKLPMRVELAAYTLEEPPYFRSSLMGSAQHVKRLQQENAQVRMMFALEMIGYFTDVPNSQHYPMPLMRLFYPDKGHFIAVVGQFFKGSDVRTIKRAMQKASPLPVYSLNAPGWVPGVDFSDHVSFWNADLPAVMITDTAFYRYEHYHSPTDTTERLDYQCMAMVVQGVYGAVLALADMPGGE